MNQALTSITIHNLDPIVYEKLKERASMSSISLNRLMKLLLAQSLGLEKSTKIADFSEFSQVWSESERAEFETSQRHFSSVDPEDWQLAKQ